MSRLTAALAFVLVLGIPAHAHAGTAALSFDPAQSRALLDSNPQDVALGDVDGDGLLDAISPNSSAGSLLRGHITGLTPPSTVTSNSANYSAGLHDMTDDGLLDQVAVANIVGVRPGNGDGTFGAEVLTAGAIGSGSEEASPTVADFDGDGTLDVLGNVRTGSPNGESAFVFAIGDGTGAFDDDAYLTYGPPGGSETGGETAADIDGDGDVDAIAVSNVGPTAAVVTARNGGTGAFAAPLVTPMNGQDGLLSPRRVDRPGPADHVAYVRPNTLSIVTGFTPAGAPDTASSVTTMAAPEVLEIADVDLDGIDDAIVGGGSGVEIHRGTAGGFAGGTPLAMGQNVDRIAVGDINGDGRPDLVAVGNGLATIAYRLNTTPTTVAFDPVPDAGSASVGTTGPAFGATLKAIAGAGDVESVSVTGAHASDFVVAGDGCSGNRVSGGGSCTVAVRFAPSAAGARTAELRAMLADGTERAVTLTGTGTAAPAPSVVTRDVLVPGPSPAPVVTTTTALPVTLAAPALRSLRSLALPGGLLLVTGEVTRPGRVAVTLSFKRGRRTVRAGRASVTATRAGTVALVVRPTAAARRALRTRLAVRGTATYTPTGARAQRPLRVAARLRRR